MKKKIKLITIKQIKQLISKGNRKHNITFSVDPEITHYSKFSANPKVEIYL